MINEISIFGKKSKAIPMKRIKELFSRFGLMCIPVDEYTGFLSRPPYDIRFAPTEYKGTIGTRLTYKMGKTVVEDSIYFSEHDLFEFLYQNSNNIRKGEKIMESLKNAETLLGLLDE